MATVVMLWNPGGSLETVVQGVGAAIQSSFLVGLTFNTANTTVNDNGTTRAIQKGEVVQAIRTLEEYLERDTGTIFG